MKKFNEWPLILRAIIIYILTIFLSIIISPLLKSFYIFAFKPRMMGGGLFLFDTPDVEIVVGSFFIAYLFFLPLFVFYLLSKKQLIAWLIGAILPLYIALTNGFRFIFWTIILSFLGWLLAQIILKFKRL